MFRSRELMQKMCENGYRFNMGRVAEKYFSADGKGVEYKTAKYECHCSRAYLAEVLASIGEAEMRKIIQEDGCIRVHCHYCNTEYVFTEDDVELVFNRG